MYEILSRINRPEDLKDLFPSELPKLAEEIRDYIISTVSKTGGHLASSLGAVELSIALHYCYNTPKDKIIWDVGHQCYAHKIITGRRERFCTLREYQGISGFPKSKESAFDSFNTGHSSTSISAGLGMAIAIPLIVWRVPGVVKVAVPIILVLMIQYILLVVWISKKINQMIAS